MALVSQLILASQSPFRKALLAAAGVDVTAIPAAIDEAAITAASPLLLASARAEAKGLAVSHLHPQALVIGADQVLSLGMRSFDKAQTAGEATQRLTEFSGRTHYLHSAFMLAHGGRVIHAEVVDLAMQMRPLTSAEIAAYVATGEWQGSVGCYQYEKRGIQLFTCVTADQSAIVGLPLQQLLGVLRDFGINPLQQQKGPWSLEKVD